MKSKLAIDKVFVSYAGLDNDLDQVLVQPMLGEVINSGGTTGVDISTISTTSLLITMMSLGLRNRLLRP